MGSKKTSALFVSPSFPDIKSVLVLQEIYFVFILPVGIKMCVRNVVFNSLVILLGARIHVKAKRDLPLNLPFRSWHSQITKG